MEEQALLGVAHVDPQQLGDPVEAVEHGVAVGVEALGGVQGAAAAGDVGVQGAQQLAAALLVVGDQGAEGVLVEAAQLFRGGDGGQQAVDAEGPK